MSRDCPLSGLVDCCLFGEKLAICFNGANRLDETTCTITSCDPDSSKANQQAVIGIKMSKESNASHA